MALLFEAPNHKRLKQKKENARSMFFMSLKKLDSKKEKKKNINCVLHNSKIKVQSYTFLFVFFYHVQKD
jgi:hypothetical protein